jgi:hypothetical protein
LVPSAETATVPISPGEARNLVISFPVSPSLSDNPEDELAKTNFLDLPKKQALQQGKESASD